MGGRSIIFPRLPFILSRIIPSASTVPKTIPWTRPGISACPTPNPAGGEWIGVPNLRRQLRLSVGGQRVQGSQSRLKPAPRSPLINKRQSPYDPEENLGRE
ncbi:hypothetical protein CDAR_10501 [Caerostris darwini]|uniref:Uncharacterized protein n=1 Tax=Caerostris darwini TaxID=1538125 RepID=A0AAV4UYL4_9ARAC|nr:hypothetical protein CDAR_10501 [Caerostris darwini]